MSNIVSTIKNSTVNISSFNKGKANQIFSDVRATGPKIVLRNNNPECVLISPDEYEKMMEIIEDYELSMIASERFKKYDPSEVITGEEIDQKFNISAKDLEGWEDIEFE